MKSIVSFLVFGAIAVSTSIFTSCDDQQAITLEPLAAVSEMESEVDLHIFDTSRENIDNLTEQQLVDSLYTYHVNVLEMEPDMALRSAKWKARALKGEAIYLSKYEVDKLPSVQDPSTGHSTMTTPKGTFYFVMPSCICGYVVYEEKYFSGPNTTMLTCGCIDFD